MFAIEAQYNQYGKVTFNDSNVTWKPSAFSLLANIGYSFDSGWRPYSIVGFSSMDLNEKNNLISTNKDNPIHLGFGVQYIPEFKKTLRLE